MAVLLLVALFAVGYWFVALGPGRQLVSPAGSNVAEFSGDGDQTTDSFTVREGWAIEWQSSGERFAYAIRGDRDFGTVIDIDAPGNGVTSPTGSGTFFLDVTAEGPWSITVRQGD